MKTADFTKAVPRLMNGGVLLHTSPIYGPKAYVRCPIFTLTTKEDTMVSKKILRAKPVLLALILAVSAFLSCGCSFQVRSPGYTTETQTQSAGEVQTPEPTPSPVPVHSPIVFSVLESGAAEAYMRAQLCAHVGSIADVFSAPNAVFGQNAYEYRAIAGGSISEKAVVFRFTVDSVGFEFIISAENGRILKKQISSPGAFPKLMEDAGALAVPKGTPYEELRTAAGVDPYLWMSFVEPGAVSDERRYEVCVWPDNNGQMAAVVQNGIVLACEYQPDDAVLPAAAADGITPRVPRYLKAEPRNANDKLSKYEPFKKYMSIGLGKTESEVTALLGAPANAGIDGNYRVLSYEYSDPEFAGGKAAFEYYFTNDGSASLVMKRSKALPLGGEQILGRYAPQMLSEMSLKVITEFMGDDPLETGSRSAGSGEVLTEYSYVGFPASVSGIFVKSGSAKLCLMNEMFTLDINEAQTLYEEYVLPVDGTGRQAPEQEIRIPDFGVTFKPFTPVPIIPDTPKPTPIIIRPSISLIAGTPTPKPTPTFVVISPGGGRGTPKPTPEPTPTYIIIPSGMLD